MGTEKGTKLFKPGHKRIENSGRAKNTPNKKTFFNLKNYFEYHQIQVADILWNDILLLEPLDRVKAIICILPYCMPKLAELPPPPQEVIDVCSPQDIMKIIGQADTKKIGSNDSAE